ncbi:InlB B-repeat-containing protein [Mycoplasma sp. P36-A1]|uniref:InlB B-repeat-containing protein n=1 Tax=Mycoplasma sp. P36-A1 TaxID=3252900 RepID=UPI003C2B4BF0
MKENNNKALKYTLGLLILVIVIIFNMTTVKSYNNQKQVSTNIATGDVANINWVVDSNYKLTISAKENTDGMMPEMLLDNLEYKYYKNKILSIEILDGVKFPENSSSMFSNFITVKSIDLNGLDTSHAVNMTAVFDNCIELEFLNLGPNFDTSNTNKMTYLFQNLKKLKHLDLGEKFDTSKVKDIVRTFKGMEVIEELDLGEKFDMSSVTSTQQAFQDMFKLKSLDLKDKFDTSNVTSMLGMFQNMRSLESLNLGDKFNTEKVVIMATMFSGLYVLPELDLSGFYIDNRVDLYAMFSSTNIKRLILGKGINTLSNSGLKEIEEREGYTSNWVNVDKTFRGNSLKLSVSYKPSMAGIYTHEKAYNVNFVVEDVSTLAKVADQTKVNSSDIPNTTVDGKNFKGWYSNKNGLGTEYQPNMDLVAKHMKVYAYFSNNTYSLNFDGNTGLGNMSSVDVEYSKKIKLPKNSFEKKGYSFAGWATSKDNANNQIIQYEDESYFQQSNTKDNILYASWKEATYKLNFDSNSGKGSMKELEMKLNETKKLSKNSFVKDGYQFIGWSSSKTNAENNIISYQDQQDYTYKDEKNITLYASWKPNTYNISFNPNGGEGMMSNIKVNFNETILLEKSKFIKTDSDFIGWAISKSDAKNGIVSYDDNQEYKHNISNDIELHAVWDKKKINISFYANQGNGTMTSLNVNSTDYITLPINSFKRKGFHFIGWSTTIENANKGIVKYEDREKLTVSKIKLQKQMKTNDIDISLYASWKKIDNSNVIDNKEDVSLPSTGKNANEIITIIVLLSICIFIIVLKLKYSRSKNNN